MIHKYFISISILFFSLSFLHESVSKPVSKSATKKINQEVSTTDEIPTLLESLNATEKTKGNIQRDLAEEHDLELNTPVNKATKSSTLVPINKNSINLGDVELQISERPEETFERVIQKNSNAKMIIKRKPSSKKKKKQK